MKKKSYFVFLLLAAFLIRVIFILGAHYISPDGTHYASLGYHLFHDLRYVSDGAQFPDIIQPPLYPFLIGPFTLLLKAELAGKMVSLIFGLALVFGMFRFVRAFTGNETLALWSALFVALNPGLVAVSSQVASEALYLFLLFLLYATVMFYLKENRLKHVLAAGFLSGFIYLTRPEGMLYMGVLLSVFLLWRKPWRHVLLYLTIVIVFMGGYAAAVYSSSGFWTPSAKLSFVHAQRTVSRYFLYKDRQSNHQTGKNIHLQRVQYALAPDHKALAVNEIFKKNKKTLEYFKVSQIKEKSKKQLLVWMAQHFFSNSILAAKKFLNGWAFPWGFWVFIVFGFWSFPFKKWKRALIFSAMFLVPVLIVLFVNVEQRFLFIVPVLLSPLLGRGWIRTERFLNERIISKKRRFLSWIILYLFVFLSVYPGYADIWRKTRAKDYYYRVGQWLQKKVPDKNVVAAVVPQAVFFAGKRYCPLPFAPLDSLELYLRRNRVDFILLEDRDQTIRPGLLNRNRLPHFLQPDTILQLTSGKFWLLRVIKEKSHERTNAIH